MVESSPEVAIVGGGAIGTSILFHLVKRHGVTDAVLFEKDQLGSGSTSKAAGGIRNTFTTEMNIELGNRNIEFFNNFEEEVGKPLDFRQTGYMYLFHDDEHERQWRERAAFYSDRDVRAEILSPEEAADIFEPLNAEEVSGALFAPDCGHVDPHMLTQALGKSATERGATVKTKTSVTDIITEDEQVVGVEAEDGNYEVDTVVNAAGPWAHRVAEMVGVEVPIDHMVRRIMVTSPAGDPGSPLIIDPERECYFKTEQNGSMLVCDQGQDIHDIDDPDTAVGGEISYSYYLDASETVKPLVPVITDLDVINGWAGIQSHTPDGHAVLGPTDVEGFLLACGLSGHGVQQAPSIGAAIADLIVEGETDVFNVDHLSIGRFEDGNLIEPEGMA